MGVKTIWESQYTEYIPFVIRHFESGANILEKPEILSVKIDY